MTKPNFANDQKKKMEIWRETNISTKEHGTQSKNRKTGEPVYHSYILPRRNWTETVYSGIRKELNEYLDNPEYDVKAHTGTHNLLSSWVVCSNLYFMVRTNESLRQIMLRFLQENVSDQIFEINDVQLEFAFPEKDELHPSRLLGEMDGSRGSGQTSPDIAFLVKTKTGFGLVMTENKFVEHSFYPCSARRTTSKGEHEGNPDPSRCMKATIGYVHKSNCHQTTWGRKYWSLLNLSEFGKRTLQRCPAATAGYQLFRQQALAEGIAQSGRYALVASTVAFDERNTDLSGCLKTTGINDFQTGWGKLFEGKAMFTTWTHQEWVQFVRDNQVNGEFDEWLEYLKERYYY
ncbi:MAG TPA: hypothetical protein DER09_02170 [Prolixibacteraceae bacterium]|nr:hypothetical protein [Prolixibacteraceae bacterium]